MIQIINDRFFSFDIETSENLVSVNLMIDPQDFELKSYKKSPFASIIIENEELVKEIEDKRMKNLLSHEYILTTITEYFTHYYYWQYNLYSDSEYDMYTNKFDNRRFHTMIYYFDRTMDVLEESKAMIIAAVPIKGIAAPITKSYHYKLYNGCLISCKPFKWNETDMFYNKIMYILVDIKSMFSFQEFIRTQDEKIGIMNDYIWYNTSSNNPYCNMTTTTLQYEGKEDLFEKPMKNIFYLSDVPKDIMTKRETISVKM